MEIGINSRIEINRRSEREREKTEEIYFLLSSSSSSSSSSLLGFSSFRHKKGQDYGVHAEGVPSHNSMSFSVTDNNSTLLPPLSSFRPPLFLYQKKIPLLFQRNLFLNIYIRKNDRNVEYDGCI